MFDSMVDGQTFDAYAKPPQALRDVYKKLHKMRDPQLQTDEDIFDARNLSQGCSSGLRVISKISSNSLKHAFEAFSPFRQEHSALRLEPSEALVYEHSAFPGQP